MIQRRVSAHGHHPVAGLQTGSVGQRIREYKCRLAEAEPIHLPEGIL